MRPSCAALLALLALALLPGAAQAQGVEDTIYESLSIPTVDGDRIHVEVARPKGVAGAFARHGTLFTAGELRSFRRAR